MDDTTNTQIDITQYEALFEPKSGGGGGSKKSDFKFHGRKTSRAARAETIENSIEKRIQKSLEILKKDLENLDLQDENKYENYNKWLQRIYSRENNLFEDHELEESFTRSSGPGGQNVNKVNSAVNLKHTPTNIFVENQESREQSQNREKSRELLNEKLKNHLNIWKNIIGNFYNQKRVLAILDEIKLYPQ